MGKTRIKVKAKAGKGKGSPSVINGKMKMKPYVGNEAEEQRMRADSLQRELDSLKVQVKAQWRGK